MSDLKIKYIGSREILNYSDLSSTAQEIIDNECGDLAGYQDLSYFINSSGVPELFDFMRIDKSDTLKSSFDGYKSDSYFSGSLCILGKDGDNFKLFDYFS